MLRHLLPFLSAAAVTEPPLSRRVDREELRHALHTLDLGLLRLDRELERSLLAATRQQALVERTGALLGAPIATAPVPAAVGDSVPRLLPGARAEALRPLGHAVTDDGWSLWAELHATPRAFQALGMGLGEPEPARRSRTPFHASPELLEALRQQGRAVDQLWRDVARVHGRLQSLEREVEILVRRIERGRRLPCQIELLRARASTLAQLLATPVLAPDELRLSVAAYRLLHRYRDPRG